MENIRVLRMYNPFTLEVYVCDINRMIYNSRHFIDHLAAPHTDNYIIRSVALEDFECIFPEANRDKIECMWDILTEVKGFSVVSNDADKFERYRLTIFNKIWEWCA